MVTPNGDGDYPTIQAAINASTENDTIQLGDGTFAGSGNRDLVFRTQRIVIRSTSGDPMNCVIDCGGSTSEPHRGFVCDSTKGSKVVLVGFSVVNGYAIGGGGGILCKSGSSPRLVNISFMSHKVPALTCDNALVEIENCHFEDNPGGAISAHGGDLQITASIFANNFAANAGAALSSSGSAVTISACRFVHNSASFAGAALDIINPGSSNNASLALEKCDFYDNAASYHGGAIHVANTTFEIVGCEFVRNIAGIKGGAFWGTELAAGTLSQCLFFNNSATNGSVINNSGSSLVLDHALCISNFDGAPLVCDSTSGAPSIAISCSDMFNNQQGDYIGCASDQSGINGNVSTDPLFCDPENDFFSLQSGSPVAPPASQCGLIGPLAVGCAAHRHFAASTSAGVRTKKRALQPRLLPRSN
jgi:hypothetical protein